MEKLHVSYREKDRIQVEVGTCFRCRKGCASINRRRLRNVVYSLKDFARGLSSGKDAAAKESSKEGSVEEMRSS